MNLSTAVDICLPGFVAPVDVQPPTREEHDEAIREDERRAARQVIDGLLADNGSLVDKNRELSEELRALRDLLHDFTDRAQQALHPIR